jgi:hypothetical protein
MWLSRGSRGPTQELEHWELRVAAPSDVPSDPISDKLEVSRTLSLFNNDGIHMFTQSQHLTKILQSQSSAHSVDPYGNLLASS